MKKGSFSTELDSLIPSTSRKVGRPAKYTHEIRTSSKEGLPPAETRATFILHEEALDKLKAIAYWDRKTIREVISEAVALYIGTWEKANGAVKEKPKK